MVEKISDLERVAANFDWIGENIERIRKEVGSDERYFAVNGGEILEASDESERLQDKYSSPIVIISISDYLGVFEMLKGD